MLSELTHAIRNLRSAPTFTAAAVLSLTLAIATSSIVFSLIDAALFRQAPFADAERLTVLNITQRTPLEGEVRHRWSWRRFELLQRDVRSFEDVASSSNNVLTITGVDDPEPLPVEMVSPRYLALLRAPLVRGRGFADDRPEPRVVLGYELWRRRFGEADVLAGVLVLNGVPLTIAGVVGPGFAGVSGLAQAWVPASMAPLLSYRDYLTTNQNFITVIGRLRPGMTLEAARDELATLGSRIHAVEPSETDTPDDVFSATAMTLNEARIDVVTRRALILLGAAVVVLLCIACANVASLLLGRATERRRETAIRVALGARRRQLVRQFLLESGVLAGISGAMTVLVLAWVLPFVRIPATLSRGRNFFGAVGEFAIPALDWRALVFTASICVCTVLLCGLVPALRATRADVDNDLRAAGTRTVIGGSLFARELMVAFQVALALVLFVGCGLLLTSYVRLRQSPTGFLPERLLTFMIRPSEVTYVPAAAPALLDRVLAEITREPSVIAATVDGCAPLSMQCASASLQIVGRPWGNAAEAPTVLRHYVAPAHFETLGMTLIRGRGLSAADRAGRPHVVVINQAAADRFWPSEVPLGKRVWFEGAPVFGDPESSAEIVGIVSNVAYRPLDEQPVQPDFFTSYAQFTYPTRMVLVRTRGEPETSIAAIAQAVRRADPDLALFDVQTMEARAGMSWAKPRFQTTLFMMVGGIALLLAVTGVYALAAHLVASRTREIGVRMALGANAVQIARGALVRSLRLALAGSVAGLLVSLASSQIMRAMLYDTSPFDPRVFVGAAIVLSAALVAATVVPIRRALRVDPSEVLRSE